MSSSDEDSESVSVDNSSESNLSETQEEQKRNDPLNHQSQIFTALKGILGDYGKNKSDGEIYNSFSKYIEKTRSKNPVESEPKKEKGGSQPVPKEKEKPGSFDSEIKKEVSTRKKSFLKSLEDDSEERENSRQKRKSVIEEKGKDKRKSVLKEKEGPKEKRKSSAEEEPEERKSVSSVEDDSKAKERRKSVFRENKPRKSQIRANEESFEFRRSSNTERAKNSSKKLNRGVLAVKLLSKLGMRQATSERHENQIETEEEQSSKSKLQETPKTKGKTEEPLKPRETKFPKPTDENLQISQPQQKEAEAVSLVKTKKAEQLGERERQLEEKERQIEEQVNSLKAEMTKMRERISALLKENILLKIEKNKEQEEIDKLRKELEFLQVKLDEQESSTISKERLSSIESRFLNESKELKNSVEKLEKEKEELSRSLQMRIEGNQSLLQKVKSLEEKLSDKELEKKAQELLGENCPSTENMSMASLFSAMAKKIEEIKEEYSKKSSLLEENSRILEEKIKESGKAEEDKRKMEETLKKRIETLTNESIGPDEVHLVSLVSKFEGIIQAKENEKSDFKKEVEELKGKIKRLEKKENLEDSDHSRQRRFSLKIKELEQQMEFIRLSERNKENSALTTKTQRVLVSIASELKEALDDQEFLEFLKRIGAVSEELEDFLKKEAKNERILGVLPVWLTNDQGMQRDPDHSNTLKIARKERRGYSEMMMSKSRSKDKFLKGNQEKTGAPRGKDRQGPMTLERKADGIEKYSQYSQCSKESSNDERRSSKPKEGKSLLQRSKSFLGELFDETQSTLKLFDLRKTSMGSMSYGENQDEITAKKERDLGKRVAQLEEENSRLRVFEKNIKTKSIIELEEAYDVQSRLIHLEQAVKSLASTRKAKPFGFEGPNDRPLLSLRRRGTFGKNGTEEENKEENSSLSEKEARKKSDESKGTLLFERNQQMQNVGGLSLSGVHSSHDSSFSFDDSKTKAYIANDSTIYSMRNSKKTRPMIESSLPQLGFGGGLLFSERKPQQSQGSFSLGLKNTKIPKGVQEAIGRTKSLFASPLPRMPKTSSILFVKQAFSPEPNDPESFLVPQHSPRFLEERSNSFVSSGTNNQMDQRSPVYSFKNNSVFLSEEPIDKNPCRVPFDEVFFSHQKINLAKHFRKLIERNQHNYVAVFGGNGCGMKIVKKQISQELVGFLVRNKRRIENQKVSLTFINSSLKRENVNGSFYQRNQLKKNEISISLAQLEVCPNLIFGDYLSEIIRPGTQKMPDRKSSCFIQVSFKMDKLKEQRSLSLLILRKTWLGVISEDLALEPGIHRMINWGLMELRQMASPYYKNQKQIEEVVKKNLEKSNVSILLCMNSASHKVQEALHSISIYNLIRAEKPSFSFVLGSRESGESLILKGEGPSLSSQSSQRLRSQMGLSSFQQEPLHHFTIDNSLFEKKKSDLSSLFLEGKRDNQEEILGSVLSEDKPNEEIESEKWKPAHLKETQSHFKQESSQFKPKFIGKKFSRKTQSQTNNTKATIRASVSEKTSKNL